MTYGYTAPLTPESVVGCKLVITIYDRLIKDLEDYGVNSHFCLHATEQSVQELLSVAKSNRERMRQLAEEESRTYSDMQRVHEELKSDFVGQSVIAVSRLTQEDYESIGTKKETQNIIALREALAALEKNGIRGIPSEGRVALWCGQTSRETLGKKMVVDPSAEYADLNTPAFEFLFGLVVDSFIERGVSMPKAISAISGLFASHAHEVVNVYLSSDRSSEEAGLTEDNHFWNGELPVLQRLVQEGKVAKIMLHRYNEKENKWDPPLELNSTQIDQIPLYRRTAYAASLPELTDEQKLFLNLKKDEYGGKSESDKTSVFDTRADLDTIRKLPARPHTTVGSVRKVGKSLMSNLMLLGKARKEELQEIKKFYQERGRDSEHAVQETVDYVLQVLKSNLDKYPHQSDVVNIKLLQQLPPEIQNGVYGALGINPDLYKQKPESFAPVLPTAQPRPLGFSSFSPPPPPGGTSSKGKPGSMFSFAPSSTSFAPSSSAVGPITPKTRATMLNKELSKALTAKSINDAIEKNKQKLEPTLTPSSAPKF